MIPRYIPLVKMHLIVFYLILSYDILSLEACGNKNSTVIYMTQNIQNSPDNIN